MALPVNIDDLVNHRKVEWARIEYKEGWNPEKVLHTLCAFANDIDNWGGGYVILGVAEKDGKPVFPEKFRLFAKQDRNRRIGDFLKELELAEARNTGYPAILRAVEQNGSPKPIIETNPSRDYFTFVLPVHKYFLQSNAKTVHELNGTDPVTLSSTVPVPYQFRTSSCTCAEAAFRVERRLSHAL